MAKTPLPKVYTDTSTFKLPDLVIENEWYFFWNQKGSRTSNQVSFWYKKNKFTLSNDFKKCKGVIYWKEIWCRAEFSVGTGIDIKTCRDIQGHGALFYPLPDGSFWKALTSTWPWKSDLMEQHPVMFVPFLRLFVVLYVLVGMYVCVCCLNMLFNNQLYVVSCLVQCRCH